MLTREDLAALRAAVPADPDLRRLLETLEQRAAHVLATPPQVPQVKALLSRNGGFCPTDGSVLEFDPWSPTLHRCPRCGQSHAGDRHHRNWARAQHLWLAERTAELALIAALGDSEPAAARASELLETYGELYFALPNRDNVLGPSHLFFSTYLESLWLTSYLAAATLLRESDRLSESAADAVSRVAEEAATLIGDFNEGLSNRQTWHAAALTAIGAWFQDLDLAQTAVEGRTGLLGHLADGFGADGLWWEGENYHLFALRGLMQGMQWARALGFDLLEREDVREHFAQAALAPSRTALPDFTYPARRDSRYGVSLAQPASLELWEIARAWLVPERPLDAWLAALYAIPLPLPPAEHYDAWLHDAGQPPRETRSRSDLSWWALIAMQPAPEQAPPWQPASGLLADQGLAVLRREQRYASLECGPSVGGHGHPDRLHLTLHTRGVHWLPDPGTGSYVQPTLHWYRSALAHNAPLLDGENAAGENASCEAFEEVGAWAWCRGRAGPLRRTLVLGTSPLLDVPEYRDVPPRNLQLPWHWQGELTLGTPGRWEPTVLEHSFVTRAERFVPEADSPLLSLTATRGDREVRALFHAPGAELVRALAPGLPIAPDPRAFLLLRALTGKVRWVSVIDWAEPAAADAMSRLTVEDERIQLATGAAEYVYQFSQNGLELRHGSERVTLGGQRPSAWRPKPIFEARSDVTAEGYAPRIAEAPPLDGSLSGFNLSVPLALDSEHQYRRSEEPYDPERFSAQAWINWDGQSLYLAVEVSKPELCFRSADAPPLLLDNDPEDVHSDGLQVYLDVAGHLRGGLVVPQEGGRLHCRILGGSTLEGWAIRGSWAPVDLGYRVTLELMDAAIRNLGPGARVPFDLLINELLPGRVRRAGQLAWSGGNGWVYLRGDAHDLTQAGTLELG